MITAALNYAECVNVRAFGFWNHHVNCHQQLNVLTRSNCWWRLIKGGRRLFRNIEQTTTRDLMSAWPGNKIPMHQNTLRTVWHRILTSGRDGLPPKPPKTPNLPPLPPGNVVDIHSDLCGVYLTVKSLIQAAVQEIEQWLFSSAERFLFCLWLDAMLLIFYLWSQRIFTVCHLK